MRTEDHYPGLNGKAEINGTPAHMLGCCGIFGVAYISGKPVQEVFDAYKTKHKLGPKWKGRTQTSSLRALMRDMGIKVELCAQYEGITLARFVRDYAIPGVTYLVRIAGHVLTIKDGCKIDQNGVTPLGGYRRSKSRITHCWEVVA